MWTSMIPFRPAKFRPVTSNRVTSQPFEPVTRTGWLEDEFPFAYSAKWSWKKSLNFFSPIKYATPKSLVRLAIGWVSLGRPIFRGKTVSFREGTGLLRYVPFGVWRLLLPITSTFFLYLPTWMVDWFMVNVIPGSPKTIFWMVFLKDYCFSKGLLSTNPGKCLVYGLWLPWILWEPFLRYLRFDSKIPYFEKNTTTRSSCGLPLWDVCVGSGHDHLVRTGWNEFFLCK